MLSHIAEARSIYTLQLTDFELLIRAILTGEYSPENFYRDFTYNVLLVHEILAEYESVVDKSVECVESIEIFKTFLHALSALPNTEREEFDEAFAHLH